MQQGKPHPSVHGDGLVFSSLSSLLRLQAQVRTLQLAKRHAQAKHVGMHRSRFKGRGMDFAESRPYQAGDDIRTIDWRVTARTGKAHTKIFQEEREKPVLVWLDLRAPMFFATRGQFKSVVAAEVASLLLWKTLAEGDRAGGVLQDDQRAIELKPARSRAAALNVMRKLATATQQTPANIKADPHSLQDSWRRLRRVTATGTQVFIISDFRAVSAVALQQLAMMNRHAQVGLISVRDPFEEQLPDYERLRLSDGENSVWVNLKQKLWRQSYQQREAEQRSTLRDFSRRHHIALIELATNDSVTERLRKLSRGTR